MNGRISFTTVFHCLVIAAVLLLPVAAGAADIVLNPGYIAGTVDAGSGNVVSVSVSATGGGYSSSKSVSTKDYSLTVQGGDWNYSVSASAQVRQGSAYYPYTNLNFSGRSFPVHIGETVANNYSATGAVRFHLSITGDPYSSWSAYGYASKAASGGNEQTNSYSYTYSGYSPDKTWVMPVVPNNQVRIYSYVYVDNSIYYFWYDASSYLYKDIAAGQTVDVYMNLVYVKPPPPYCQVHPEQCPPPQYDYGTVQGTVNLDIAEPGAFKQHYVQGYYYTSIYSNPGSFKHDNVRTGSWGYRINTYFDNNTTTYQWPNSTGYKVAAVQKGQTSYLDFNDSTGVLTGKLKLTGTLQNNTVNSYSLNNYGANRIYTPGQGWVTQPTNGGYSSIARTGADGKDSYRYFLSGGFWNPYYFYMNKYDYTSGYYHRLTLSMYDYNYYYDGSTYNFGQPAIITPGSTTVQDREICFGSVVIRFRDYSGGTMSYPQVWGSGVRYNSSNKQERSISVSANHNIPNAAAPEVEVHGPAATYTLSSRATAQDGTSISFPPIGIALECGVRKCSDRKAPSITMSSPAPELITNALSVTVSGTTTDEFGVKAVTVNNNAAQWWLTGNPHEVAFTYDLALAPGRNHIRTFIENTECNSCFDERNVYVDRWMPAVTIVTPGHGDIYTPNGPTLPVSVNAADQGYGYTLTVYLDGTKIGQVTGPANENAPAAIVFDNSIGPLAEGSHIVKAVALDLAGNRAEATATIVSNRPPTAEAGPDQTVECASANGTPIILNGSGSSDPDNDPLTYTWTWSGGSATGVSPALTLPLGTHMITLTVDDGKGGTATDTVTIIVRDTTPPVTTVRSISGVAGDNGWYTSDVTITVDSTDACSGVKEIQYSVDGAAAAVPGSTATITVKGDGIHGVTFGATDNAGNVEQSKTLLISIDKTTPSANISVTPGILWPPNHKMVNVAVNGGSTDATSGVASVVFTVADEYGTVQPAVSGFNTTIPLEAWREGADMDGRHYTITAVITDKAGNKTTVTTEAVCPHDMRDKQ